MEKSNIYLDEKFSEAAQIMATHRGNAKERLFEVMRRLIILSPNDFPDQHKDKWLDIQKRCNKSGVKLRPDGNVFMGSLENTIGSLRISTAADILSDIYEIHNELRIETI